LADLPWQVQPNGLTLSLRLTPRAKCARVDGIGADPQNRPVLLFRVPAPPVDGAANAALLAELAALLGIPKSAITLTSGPTARIKRLHIAGNGAALAASLSRLAQPTE